MLLILSGYLGGDALGDNPYLSVIVIQLLIFVLPALFFCRLRGKDYGRKIRISFFELGTIPFIIIACVSLMLASCAVKFGIYSLLDYTVSSSDIYGYAVEGEISAGDGGTEAVAAIFAFAIFPAVTEELVFRGIMIAEYEECGVVGAALMSSLLFAMLHLEPVLLPVYFVSGLILALSVYVTRSILAPILIHTANNIFSLFLEDYLWERILQPRNLMVFAFLIVSLTLLAFTLMFGEACRIYRSYGKDGVPSEYVIPKKKRTPTVYAVMTIPFAICLVIFIFAAMI